jgi:hypothetical protein
MILDMAAKSYEETPQKGMAEKLPPPSPAVPFQ